MIGEIIPEILGFELASFLDKKSSCVWERRLHRTVFAPVRTVRPVRRFLKNELFALFAVRTVRTM